MDPPQKQVRCIHSTPTERRPRIKEDTVDLVSDGRSGKRRVTRGHMGSHVRYQQPQPMAPRGPMTRNLLEESE